MTDLIERLDVLREFAKGYLPISTMVITRRDAIDFIAEIDRLRKVEAEAERRGIETLDKAVHAAAVRWLGEKDRETFPDEVTYFQNHWRTFPGFYARVERELGVLTLAALKVEG